MAGIYIFCYAQFASLGVRAHKGRAVRSARHFATIAHAVPFIKLLHC